MKEITETLPRSRLEPWGRGWTRQTHRPNICCCFSSKLITQRDKLELLPRYTTIEHYATLTTA
ncbi:hypothetical protein M3J09_012175 [Ascochyta lentis]